MKYLTTIVLGLGSSLLLGCSNSLSNTVEKSNEKLEAEQSPYRYVKFEEESSHISYRLEVAGTRSETIAKHSDVLLADIFSGFTNECGFSKKDLVSVHKVKYDSPVFYEVWTFNDPLSGRNDKMSSMSVILTAYPNNGGTDISFVGSCHAKPVQLTISN